MYSNKQIIILILSFLAAALICARTAASAENNKIFYVQGSTETNRISLTFDDGPAAATPEILDLLEQYGAKATFFMLGENVAAKPDSARKVLSAGHEIGTHSFSHPNFYTYKEEDKESVLSKELDSAAEVFKKELGFNPKLLRMPHGFVRAWVKKIAQEKGYVLVNWTFGKDWKNDPLEELIIEYTKEIKPGAILLMHDGGGKRKKTVEILKAVLEECKKRGYSAVTVSELCGIDTAAK